MPDASASEFAFLFVDMEGSTRLLEHLESDYVPLLTQYRTLIDGAVAAHGGTTIVPQGDGQVVTFPQPAASVSAAIEIQRGLAGASWPAGVTVRARIGLHAGAAVETDAGLVGMEIHRAARIAAAGHGGQVLLTHAVIDRMGDLPPGVAVRDLGSHRFKDLALAGKVFQLDMAGLPGEFPPINSLDLRPHNLPVQLTRFVGMDATVALVDETLVEERLITLTGTGGAGKTRLAVQVGAEALHRYPDGVWIVELASVQAPDMVPSQLAAALNLDERPDTPVEQVLHDYLSRRKALVILDNCEHLVAAAATLATGLLAGCPDLSILATSRAPLGVAGEVVLRVPSLEVPDVTTEPGDIGAVPAVQLFLDRAGLVRPGFQLDPDNAVAVSDICRRLAGIPLAIELAAARLKLLSARQIADRLDDRFRLLTGGSRSAPSRHRTLQAVMDSSHVLLTRSQQILFQRLSVFAGTFTVEAVEAVCSDDLLTRPEIIDHLEGILDLSLVSPDDEVAERLKMQETIRQYAAGHLETAGEAPAIARRHAGHYRGIVSGGGADLAPPEQAEWLAGLAIDETNIRAALRRSLDAADIETAVGLAGGMARYWYRRGSYSEADGWFGRVLNQPRVGPSLDLATLLRFAAAIAADQGDAATADRLLEEEAEIAAALGDPVAAARSANARATLAWYRGDLRGARAHYTQALEALSETADPLIARILINLTLLLEDMGEVAEAAAALRRATDWAVEEGAGDFFDLERAAGVVALAEEDLAAAIEHLERAEALCRVSELHGPLALTLQDLAAARTAAGDQVGARAAGNEALDRFRHMEDHFNIAMALTALARVDLAEHDPETAAGRLQEAASIWKTDGRPAVAARTLTGFAALAFYTGRAAEAATLQGAADAAAGAIGLGWTGPLAREVDDRSTALIDRLGSDAYAAATGRGRTTIPAEAFALALEGD